jgi:hypothetical protein
MKYQAFGDYEFQRYEHVSSEIIISMNCQAFWRMTNVESLDLTNNELTELPLGNLKGLPSSGS